MKECINVPSLPKAGPYSHAIKVDGLVFVSGNVPIDPDSGESIKGDIKRATAVIFKNIETILKEAGSELTGVVKVTVFLTDMGRFAEMNEVYADIFKANPPARSCVGVKELPGGFDIEVEVIASL